MFFLMSTVKDIAGACLYHCSKVFIFFCISPTRTMPARCPSPFLFNTKVSDMMGRVVNQLNTFLPSLIMFITAVTSLPRPLLELKEISLEWLNVWNIWNVGRKSAQSRFLWKGSCTYPMLWLSLWGTLFYGANPPNHKVEWPVKEGMGHWKSLERHGDTSTH